MSRTATPLDVIEGRARWCVVEGDALQVLTTLPDGCVDAVVTDPPYASTGDAASVMMSRDGGLSVPREVQFYEAWAREHLREWVRVLKRSGAAWFTCDWRGAMAFDMAAHKLRYKTPVVGVWDRGGLGMGHILRKTYEAFVVLPMLEFARKRTDEADLWRVPWSAAHRDTTHAAQKPLELYGRALHLISDHDAVVLDPFGGSGTTGVAALHAGRRVIVVERDTDYARIARDRCDTAAQQPRTPQPRTRAAPGTLSVLDAPYRKGTP